MMTRLTLHPSKPDERLAELIERAKNHVMTKAERDAQRRSWVIGEMLLEHPKMTREYAEKIYADIEGI